MSEGLYWARPRWQPATSATHPRAWDGGAAAPAREFLSTGTFLDNWLAGAALSLAPHTTAAYRVVVEKHLKPSIGATPLAQLSPARVQQLLNEKLEAGFAPKTVVGIRQVLGTALNAALLWDLVDRNVALIARGPRRERFSTRPLTAVEARRFLASLSGHRFEALFTLALVLGLRQGEALGLVWSDVDLQGHRISVRQQLQRVNGRLTEVPLKTPHSHRVLPIALALANLLSAHKWRQEAERQRSAGQWKERGFVFTNRFGGPLQARNVIIEFHRALDSAGLHRCRFHDLRHTAATLMLLQGVEPVAVMWMLGHADLEMTMTLYGHVLPSMHAGAAMAAERWLAPAPASRT